MVELQTYFVLTRNISWWIFISSIFRRFYFPCIWKALEMKDMIKWRRAHIPLIFIYTTKKAVEQPQCSALWTSYIPVPKVSIVWNFQPVIIFTLQGFWFPCMEDDGFGKWIKEKNDAKQSTIAILIVHQIHEILACSMWSQLQWPMYCTLFLVLSI